MKHRHHILPKHMGGSDDPSNLVLLTVKEHAEAHRILYEKYGCKGDLVAWKGLSKQIDKEKISLERSSMGGQAFKERMKDPQFAKEHAERTRQQNKKLWKQNPETFTNFKYDWTGKKHKESSKRKIGLKTSIAQKGEGNSQYGTMWITNGSENKKVKKNIDSLPERWYKGRVNGNKKMLG